MGIFSKLLNVCDNNGHDNLMFELDSKKLIIREIKKSTTKVIKEFEFDEFEFCFSCEKSKDEQCVEIIYKHNFKYTFILKNDSHKKALNNYFEKHSVNQYDSDEQRNVIEWDVFSKTLVEMTEEELRKEMFSGLGYVPIENFDGTMEYIGSCYKIDGEEHCLITENGRTYHTHIGCFKNWKPEQQKNFNGWKACMIEEAESMGMKKCSFCEEADNRPEETLGDFLKWLDEEEKDLYNDDDDDDD